MVSISGYVMWKDEVIGRTVIENGKLIENTDYVHDIRKHPWGRSRTAHDILYAMSDRIIPECRVDAAMLEYFGLEKYNVYDIFRKVHGANINDFNWFKFDDDDKSLSWKDINPRIEAE